MLLLITLPIALVDTFLIYYLMSQPNRSTALERQRMIYSSLIRFTFAIQLVIELATGNKTVGGIFSFVLGLSAGILTADNLNLNTIADTLMNVFMGISMGIFLLGHLPRSLTLLLIAPVFLSSALTFLYTRAQMRNQHE